MNVSVGTRVTLPVVIFTRSLPQDFFLRLHNPAGSGFRNLPRLAEIGNFTTALRQRCFQIVRTDGRALLELLTGHAPSLTLVFFETLLFQFRDSFRHGGWSLVNHLPIDGLVHERGDGPEVTRAGPGGGREQLSAALFTSPGDIGVGVASGISIAVRRVRAAVGASQP